MEAEYNDLLARLASPEVASDHQRATEAAKQMAPLEETVRLYADYKASRDEAAEARDLLSQSADAEEQEFYRSSESEAGRTAAELEGQLLEILRPRDPRDDRSVIIEVRAGAGGDEAALFASELMRMYQRYAERRRWKTEILDVSDSPVGGIREVTFEVRGKGAYSKLKYESGVHRVQRVPATESAGRTHTSTATVAVLAEAEEVDVQISDDELKVDTYRSSGPGGQHVNTTDSAVRLTHVPSGIVVACQSERSQRQNRERAMKILHAKLQERAEAEAHAKQADARRSQVGTGDRSEKIRTYNFPQNRITDHRIGFSAHGMAQVMEGDLDSIFDALARHDAGEGAGPGA
ncbi:MAG TPA: peptide chain release factor 1 [Actinomycetota bacterium]|nr:peptide chain release factor 1 [Actinomycetota bacterium]